MTRILEELFDEAPQGHHPKGTLKWRPWWLFS